MKLDRKRSKSLENIKENGKQKGQKPKKNQIDMQHSMNIERENQKVQNCTVNNAWTIERAESLELYKMQCMDKRKSRKYRIVQNTMHGQEKEEKVEKRKL